MRPLKLKMKAFGPFKDEINIDFTELNQASLFLISGPTGSGKTTLFDAMTYALYDEASGETRDTDALKSQYADDQTLCYVELEFELGQNTYKVHREPKQRGPGERIKSKEIQANAYLEMNKKIIATKKTDVDKKLQSILGLTADQFKQIVLLPQGEFRQMLISNSSDKEKIFRNIFKTAHIEAFQELLKSKASKFKQEKKGLTEKLDHVLDNLKAMTSDKENIQDAIKVRDWQCIQEELDRLIKQGNTTIQESKEKITHYHKKSDRINQTITLMKEKQSNDQELQQLKANKDKIDNLVEKIKNYEEATKLNQLYQPMIENKSLLKDKQDRLRECLQEQGTIQSSQQELDQKINHIKEQLETISDVEEEIEHLKEECRKLREQDEKNQKKLQLQQKLNEMTKDHKRYKEKLEKLNQNISQKEQDLQSVTKWREELESIQRMIENNQEDRHAHDSYQTNLHYIHDLNQKLKELKENYNQAQADFDQKSKVAHKYEQLYLQDLAASLAYKLEDNQPCPVCGSIDHPEPAIHENTEVTKKEKDRLVQESEQARADCLSAKTELTQVMEQLEQKTSELSIKLNQLPGLIQSAKQKETELKQNKQNLIDQKNHIHHKLDQEEVWKEELNQLLEEREHVLQEYTRADKDIEYLGSEIEAITTRITELQEQITQESIDIVNQKLQSKQEWISNIRRKHEDLREKKAQYSETLASVIQEIKLIQEDENTLESKIKNYQESYNKALADSPIDESFQQFLQDEQTIKTWNKTIQEYKTNLAVIREKLSDIEHKLKTKESDKTIEENQLILEELSDTIKTLEEQREEQVKQVDRYQNSLQSITELLAKEQSISDQSKLYEELHQLASGGKKTEYISFERYVLAIYFEQILLAANQRFKVMTSGRYELERRTEKKGAGAKGLELNVLDHYTGQERSVNTLSGGEMFKASLALALGLSDVIQNELGGVRVNTLFIDEGFGTLDADSLDMAIQVLMELNATGRLIGIISHVEELKLRIPARINVNKTAQGSSLEVIV